MQTQEKCLGNHTKRSREKIQVGTSKVEHCGKSRLTSQDWSSQVNKQMDKEARYQVERKAEPVLRGAACSGQQVQVLTKSLQHKEPRKIWYMIKRRGQETYLAFKKPQMLDRVDQDSKTIIIYLFRERK